MAYDHFQRHLSVHGHSYVDGVPFKITDVFLPPPDVLLPHGFALPSQTASLVFMYDFSLETQVLEWAEALEKAKRDQEEAVSSTGPLSSGSSSGQESDLEEDSPSRGDTTFDTPVRNDYTANTQGIVGSASHIQGVTRNASSTHSVRGNATQQPLINFSANSILTPIKASNASAVHNSPTAVGQGTNSTAIDYTLFENEADPFETAELNTIDELAELKHVLQPQTLLQSSSNSAQPDGADNAILNTGGAVSLQMKDRCVTFNNNSRSTRSLVSDLTNNQIPNGNPPLTKPIPAPRKAQLPPIPASRSLTSGQPRVKNPAKSHFKSSSKPVNEHPPMPPSYESLVNGGNMSSHSGDVPQRERNIYSRHCDESLSPRNGLAPLDNHSVPCMTNPPPYSEEPDHFLNSSTPTTNFGIPLPGLVNMANLPMRRSSDQSTSETWNRYTPLPPTPTMDSPSSPGPYDALTTEQQRYVNSMTGMGFPQDSVVRLVEKFGAEQKVLDMLCMINQISEAGYRRGDVETALLLLDCDETKTTHYLEALVQLRNMGFQDNKITEALVESDLDVDQALDYLTA